MCIRDSLGIAVDDPDIFLNILIIDGNLHALAAEHVRGADEYRIAQLMGRLFCFLCGKYRMAGSPRNPALLKNLIKQLTVLCRVYIFSGGSQRDVYKRQPL